MQERRLPMAKLTTAKELVIALFQIIRTLKCMLEDERKAKERAWRFIKNHGLKYN